MSLDRAGVQRVENWLHGHAGSVHCPICGHQRWGVGDVVPPPEAAAPDEGHPVVQVVCGNCAYVMLFSTRVMGL